MLKEKKVRRGKISFDVTIEEKENDFVILFPTLKRKVLATLEIKN